MNTLADKLEKLFATFTQPDGRPFSYQDVEKGTDHAVTAAYVWKLRAGQATNPSYRVLEAIAAFFGVPISYFASEQIVSDDYVQRLKLAVELEKEGVAQIALRAGQLDAPGRQAILDMMEYVLQIKRSNYVQSANQSDAAPDEGAAA